MEKLKIYMEAVLKAIQDNQDSPGTILTGTAVLLGLIIMYCSKLKKKAKKINKHIRRWK